MLAREALPSSFRGEWIGPDDAAYDRARTTYDRRFGDRQPLLIARCADRSDVQAAVRYARAEGHEIVVRGGGHNPNGYAATNGGVVLDLSPMRSVTIDSRRRRARVDGGTLAGDVVRGAAEHDLVAVTGLYPTIGYCGLALHGGEGLLSRLYGEAGDSIIAAELVTADGDLVRACADENADLFWGLRGAGPNFGIVTAVELRLHPLPRRPVGGEMRFLGDQIDRVFPKLIDLMQEMSEGLWMMLWLSVSPAGEPYLEAVLGHVGPAGVATKEVDQIRKLGAPAKDTVVERGYVEMLGSLHWQSPFGGRCHYWADYEGARDARRLASGLLEQIDELWTSPHTGDNTGILLEPHGGGYARQPDPPCAQPRREHTPVLVQGTWRDPAETLRYQQWGADLADALKAHGIIRSGKAFLNNNSCVTEELVRAAYGRETYDRLAALKAHYDPENAFRHNHNIPPPTA